MSVDTTDPWKLSSGLRDDMVLSIHAAYFSPDAEYQGGQQYLLWLIGLDENQDEATLKMSVGADWTSSDGGTTITHPTKKQQYINGSTIYGHFITAAMEIPELQAEVRKRALGPLNAKVWEGLIIHFTEHELKFGKNIDAQMRLMPTEYFGLISEAAPTTLPPVQTAPPVAAPPVVAPPPVAVTDPAVLLAQARAAQAQAKPTGSPLYEELVSLAKVSDWPSFLNTVIADPRVLADDELALQAMDQSQLWTQANTP
jgi:hypothetical protein